MDLVERRCTMHIFRDIDIADSCLVLKREDHVIFVADQTEYTYHIIYITHDLRIANLPKEYVHEAYSLSDETCGYYLNKNNVSYERFRDQIKRVRNKLEKTTIQTDFSTNLILLL